MFPLFTQPHAESTVYNACGCVHSALRPKATNTNTTCTSKAKAKDEVDQARIRRHRMEQCREWATEQFREEPSVWHLPSNRSCVDGKHDHARREAATRGLRLHDLTSLNGHYGRGSSPSHDGHESGCTQSRDFKADILIVVKREPSPPRSTYPPTAPAKWYEDEDADARASAAAGTASRAASATALSVSAASAGLRSADTSPATSAAALPARTIAPLTRLTPSASSSTSAPRRASVPDVALWGDAPARMTAASGETSTHTAVPTSVSAPSSPSHSTLLRKRQRDSPSGPARTKRRALSPCPAPLALTVRSHARPELANSAGMGVRPSRGETSTHGPRRVHYQDAAPGAAPRIERPQPRTGASTTPVPMPLASRSTPGSPVRERRNDSERDTPVCHPASPPSSRPSSAGATSAPAAQPHAMGVSHVSLASAIMVATSATLAPRARYGCALDAPFAGAGGAGQPAGAGSAKQFEQLAKKRLAALAHVREQLATSPPPETETHTHTPRSEPAQPPTIARAHPDKPKFDTYHVAFETSPPRRARALPERSDSTLRPAASGPAVWARSVPSPTPTPRAPASLAHLLHPRPPGLSPRRV